LDGLKVKKADLSARPFFEIKGGRFGAKNVLEYI
jgi:hypothetical protein